MIISKMEKNAGFFSMFFFAVNHYLYAKKNNLAFKLDTKNWLFKYKIGWEDYFNNIDISNYNLYQEHFYHHHQEIDKFTIAEYKNAITELYIYNDSTIQKINEKKKSFDFINKSYDSIFIRRGDKMQGESKYIPSEKFLQLLLVKNPNCKTVFLQTDDYNCYLELKKYTSENHLDIEIITLCDKDLKGGMIIFSQNVDGIKGHPSQYIENRIYIKEVIDNLEKVKSIDKMNSEEIYQHTINMFIGIDIVLQSNICICDYSSNVSRFIKLMHQNINNVYDITNPNTRINMMRKECPAFGFFQDEYNYISFGSDCYPAFALRNLEFRKYALPFDWIISNTESIIECIKDNFQNFHKELNLLSNNTSLIDKYGFLFVHDYPTENENRNDIDNDTTIFYSENKIVNNWREYIDNNLKKYEKRINRFFEIANNDTPLFILYKGTIQNIPKFKEVFETKFNKKNIMYIVFSNEVSNDNNIVTCYPGTDNNTEIWLNAIHEGQSRIQNNY
jgi:hypothetical protein